MNIEYVRPLEQQSKPIASPVGQIEYVRPLEDEGSTIGKAAKYVGGKFQAGMETGMALGSSAGLFFPAKAAALANLPFGREVMDKAEEAVSSFGYKPKSPEAQRAVQLIGEQVMDRYLAFSKGLSYDAETAVENIRDALYYAEKEDPGGFAGTLKPSKIPERVADEVQWLVLTAGELFQFALLGSLKGKKAKAKTPTIDDVKLDPTYAKGQIALRRAREHAKVPDRPLDILARKEAGMKGEIPIVGERAKLTVEAEKVAQRLRDRAPITEMKPPYEGAPPILEGAEPVSRGIKQGLFEPRAKKLEAEVDYTTGRTGPMEPPIRPQELPGGEYGAKLTPAQRRTLPYPSEDITYEQAIAKRYADAELRPRKFEAAKPQPKPEPKAEAKVEKEVPKDLAVDISDVEVSNLSKAQYEKLPPDVRQRIEAKYKEGHRSVIRIAIFEGREVSGKALDSYPGLRELYNKHNEIVAEHEGVTVLEPVDEGLVPKKEKPKIDKLSRTGGQPLIVKELIDEYGFSLREAIDLTRRWRHGEITDKRFKSELAGRKPKPPAEPPKAKQPWGDAFNKTYKKSDLPHPEQWEEFRAFSKDNYSTDFPISEHFEAWMAKQPTPKAKQPWEMTREEFEGNQPAGERTRWINARTSEAGVSSGATSTKGKIKYQDVARKAAKEFDDKFNQRHEKVVKQALSEGKPVPPEVLKDYPGLKKSTILKDVNTLIGEGGEFVFKGKELTPKQQAALMRLSDDIKVIRKNAKKVGKSVEEYLKDLKFDPIVAKLLDRKAEDLEKYAKSVNLERQAIPEQYKQLETDLSLTEKLLKPRKKKVQTWDKTNKLSEEILSTYEGQFKALKKAKGIKGLTENMQAVRQINVNAIDRLAEIAKTDDINQFNKSYAEYKKVFDTLNDTSSEIGRALNIHKQDVSISRLGKAFSELKRGLNAREFAEFQKINFENPVEVKQFIDGLGNPKLIDYALEFWYNNILSGPTTHLVNTISNTGWLAFQMPHNVLVSGIDKMYSSLTGKERMRYLNEIVPRMAGYKAGAIRGKTNAAEMIRKGKITEFETKWAQEMRTAARAFERSPNATVRKIAPYISFPTRALRAMDVWANSISYDGHARALARQASNKKGLKGKERAEFERGYIEELSQADHEACMKQARYSTFMDNPDKFTNWILSLRRVPVLGKASQFVIPFVNTIANLTKRGVEMTPGVGLLKEPISRAMGRGQPTPEVIAKQVEGAILSLYVLHKLDMGEVTGKAPETKGERDAWYRQGKLPWSIRIGDNWYQYRRIEPFNTPIAMVANAYNEIKNAEDDDTASEIFLKTADGMRENLIDSSYLQGIQPLFEKYEKKKGAAPRWLASWVPYSSFWRSNNRAYEYLTEGSSKVREGMEFGPFSPEWLKAASQTIPAVSGKMPAKLNIWGEDIEIPGGVFRQWLPYKWAQATTDPVEKELDKHEIYPTLPNKTISIRGEDVRLPVDVYRDYCIAFGHEYKRQLLKKISSKSYQGRKPEQQKQILTKARTRASSKMMSKLRRKILQGEIKTTK